MEIQPITHDTQISVSHVGPIRVCYSVKHENCSKTTELLCLYVCVILSSIETGLYTARGYVRHQCFTTLN
jgi:hypothetical protein